MVRRRQRCPAVGGRKGGRERGRADARGDGGCGLSRSGDSAWRGTSRLPKVIQWPRAINSEGREKGPLPRGPGGIPGEEHIPGSPAPCPVCSARVPALLSLPVACKLCPTQGDSCGSSGSDWSRLFGALGRRGFPLPQFLF